MSRWKRRRWSMDSLFLLHMQHLSTIMTYCFLRLVIHGKDLTYNRQPRKKSHSQGSLSLPNTLSREAATFTTNQGIIEGSNLKQLSFGGDPLHLIFTFSSHSSLIHHPEEWGKDIYSLIMTRSSKAYFPLIGATIKLQVTRNRGILCTSNTK